MIFGFLLMLSLTAAPEGAAFEVHRAWSALKGLLGFGGDRDGLKPAATGDG